MTILVFIFIAYPWLALPPAVIFALLCWATRSKVVAAAAVAWAVYTLYEYLMFVRVLCSGECNIRVDLLLIYPALLALSIAAVVQTLRILISKRRT